MALAADVRLASELLCMLRLENDSVVSDDEAQAARSKLVQLPDSPFAVLAAAEPASPAKPPACLPVLAALLQATNDPAAVSMLGTAALGAIDQWHQVCQDRRFQQLQASIGVRVGHATRAAGALEAARAAFRAVDPPTPDALAGACRENRA